MDRWSVTLLSQDFPCIHPALFHYLLTKDVDIESLNGSAMLPVIGDIPRDASTADLIELIEKVI